MHITMAVGYRDAMTMPTTVSVLSINVNGYAPYEHRLPVLRQAITDLNPDLLSFQEAAYESGATHQIAACLDGLGYQIDHQFDGEPVAGHGDGNCTASRWPLERVAVEPLPTTARCGGYPVSVMCHIVHAPQPVGDLLLVNPKTNWQLHLESERESQVLAIASLVERHAVAARIPCIVAADFDAAPDNASIRFMTGRQSLDGRSTHFIDAWEVAGDGTPGYTWTSDNPFNRPIIDDWLGGGDHRRRIDYIFVASRFLVNRRVRIAACKVVMDKPTDGVYASGHYGVYAEIEVHET